MTYKRLNSGQSSEPRWGSIRHRQTSSIQTGPGPATAARSTSFAAVFISSLMVLRQVPSGLPRCLFPGGTQDSALSGCRPFFMRRTWPSHIHHLLFTSRTMLFIPVPLQISSLHTFSCHLTFNLLRKHLPSKPRSLLSNFLLVLHVSEA